MTISMTPYSGRMSYCLIKSIQMVLAHQGHHYELPWLECVSGEAFEFVYLRDHKSFFVVIGDQYHLSGEHLLRTLNYEYTYTGSSDDETALAALRIALTQGPVVAGMLDMGYLTYSPTHRQAAGADHAIVVLALEPDEVIVHDPDGYPAVPLPLNHFLNAWKRDIYTGKPYGLWQIGAQGTPPTDGEIWEKSLDLARTHMARTSVTTADGVQLLYGPEAMRTLATDLQTLPDIPLGGLPYFNWRVSGQRCLDSAFFLKEHLPEAAAIRWEESLLYGRLQQATAANQRERLPDILHRLAEHETRFIAALG
ncbi:hypothetical protein KDA_53540 [Dictyobacter alpinus]|uniref:Butirosin biosynthesis protein H N-terminal domain-containing protein n=1 Tax=Dictyobacter alpinus TaxID=2014873 RepID=A0A402BF03_9CHLR|nr:BtrH N-terminal domain-containing protein [Dictyobacter alpinus]GCE29870.1 hypothetical protein KDA_53540 [Dictyobacter alpinus]